MDLFDLGVSIPDVVEVYSQHLSTPDTRMVEKETMENQAQNSLLSDPGAESQKHSRFHIPCRSHISSLGTHSYGRLYISYEEAREIEEIVNCGHQLTAFNAEKNNGVGQKRGPVLDLDNRNVLSFVDSFAPDNWFEVSDNSGKHGRPPTNEPTYNALVSFLEPDMSVLDLLYSQANVFEPAAISGSHLSREDNVSYSEDPENSFLPSSVTDGDFGYPRIKLDLDTIDSGFADSDCGSPLECEFNKNIMVPSSSSFESDSIDAGAQHPKNYVKQWVCNNSAL